MKIESQTQVPSFKPVELKITFETKEEINDFREVMGSEYTVVNAIGKAQFHSEQVLRQRMGEIFRNLSQYA